MRNRRFRSLGVVNTSTAAPERNSAARSGSREPAICPTLLSPEGKRHLPLGVKAVRAAECDSSVARTGDEGATRLPEEEVSHKHGCYAAHNVGKECIRHCIASFLHTYAAEIHGENVEGGVGGALHTCRHSAHK